MTVTAQLVRDRLHYDPETGVFLWRVKPCRNGAAWSVAGRTDMEGYRTISISNKEYKAHRLAWLYMTGQWPEGEIDHIDCIKDNNAWKNLRDVTHQVNMQNIRRANLRSALGVLGVIWHRNRFQAQIGHNGVDKILGRFLTVEEAHAAYIAAKRQLHEGNTL